MASGAAVTHLLRRWYRRAGASRGTVILLIILALVIVFTSWTRDVGNLGPPADDEPLFVNLTLVTSAMDKGAVCLDGSPPAYHLHRGFGDGADGWVVHLEGGGWCGTLESCFKRKMSPSGSSHYMERQIVFSGILSRSQALNPDFYNWNRVIIRYCDGASFFGDVEKVSQNGLFFRGKRIWEAVMDELLLKGLASARKALLTGCSAGGLATFMHCDSFRAHLPVDTIVKCLPDGGFFLDAEDISGKRTLRNFYKNVTGLQDVVKNLQQDCISKEAAVQCFFPQEVVRRINTPVFILNSAYDWWQIQHVLAPDDSDPEKKWRNCKLSLGTCDSSQLETLQGFRNVLLNALKEFQHKKNSAVYIDSCFQHCQTHNDFTWHHQNSPRVNNKTMAEAVGDWYFDRRKVNHIDCPYPCNPTCVHLDLL